MPSKRAVAIDRRRLPLVLLAGGTVIDPAKGTVRRSDVLVENGRITAVGPSLKSPHAERIDCAGKHISPGFVDMHCARLLMKTSSSLDSM